MKICTIGAGYVGLVTGACFAELGNTVICVDKNQSKIDILNDNQVPIYEPGLKELINKNYLSGRIKFTSDLKDAVYKSDYVFICVGTPTSKNSRAADLTFVFNVAKEISKYINKFKVIITKSTVPVFTGDKIEKIISKNTRKSLFEVISNPEFLREGEALRDFRFPDRIVVGANSKKVIKKMRLLYEPLIKKGANFFSTNRRGAELIKYAANAFLATKISFINEMANLSELLGADITEVSLGIGSDERIGKRFLNAGCGYGGSCLPKDIDALIAISQKSSKKELKILKEVKEINKKQKTILFQKLKKSYKGNIRGLKIALWGLAFKPNTDDVRESPSIDIINDLISSGAIVYAHDPEAMDEFKKIIKSPNLKFCKNVASTTKFADALMVVTDWDEYINYDFSKENMKMNNMRIFDGRLCLNKEKLEDIGYEYISIGS